ncbi:YceI family protein [Yeosuana sp. MJ-SS3]|uniref:YceI family protein n=1 Tax=Gilvirhabdus luticola TaxID=3079858 RepID=A0ABU3U7Z0_9FLAO|nr:YceI family protein [Yeosuana sp. MJ-SS3]MDU8886528.1 YceI family protein [Yeosuana sp. MJ-SS3]
MLVINNKIAKVLILFIVFNLTTRISWGQEYKLVNISSELSIFGTSTLHDWEIKVENIKGSINIESLIVNSLKIEIEAESLKSGHKGMDKNTYKALETDTYKTIVFQMPNSSELSEQSEGKYLMEAKGDLTISGTTKNITLKFNVERNNDQIKLKGEKTFNMTDFNIDPPKALMGTIKTGNEITVKYHVTFNK